MRRVQVHAQQPTPGQRQSRGLPLRPLCTVAVWMGSSARSDAVLLRAYDRAPADVKQFAHSIPSNTILQFLVGGTRMPSGNMVSSR
mmetsp:Transcript_16701/g.33366  ORF Transcript_16701/g.33366 Transcript_16701/m.33366 type:complete len:86 (-) Transcript_16701:822-1079(-)